MRVSILVSERVKYHRYVEMSQEEYDRRIAELDGPRAQADKQADELRELVGTDNFQDATDLEIEVFDVVGEVAA